MSLIDLFSSYILFSQYTWSVITLKRTVPFKFLSVCPFNLLFKFDHVYMIGGVIRHILPHLPGVPHLHVNRPLFTCICTHSLWQKKKQTNKQSKKNKNKTNKKKQRVKFSWDLHWENKTYKIKRLIKLPIYWICIMTMSL